MVGQPVSGDELDDRARHQYKVVLQFLQEKELFETLLAMEGETGVKYADGDLPVASILQSSLDMFSAADAAPAEKEDADGKAACEALEALRGGACATRQAESGGPDAFAANVTAVCWAVRSFHEAHCIVATADRKLRLISDHEVLAAFEDLPSPPLSLDVAASEEAGLQKVLVTTMGGETLLLKLRHSGDSGAPSGGYPDSKDMGRWSFELCQRFKDHQKQVTSGRFAPARGAESSYFITISRDHTACVYGRPPGPHFALLGSYSFVGEVTACCWLDPLTAVLAARNDHELHYLEMEGPHAGETQEVLRTNLNALGDSVVSFAVLALAASPDGAFVAACTDRSRVILLQARSPRQLRNFYGAAVGEYDMPTVAFSLDGCFLYVSSTLPQPARREEDEVKALCGQVAIFEVRSGQMVLQLPCHEKSVRCFHRHPYSEMLVTGSFDKMVCPRGHQELERAMERLLGFLPVAQQALHRPALRDALVDARGSELRALQEAGDMISLPSFRPSTTELREQLKAVESFVARLGGRPCAVTVARSVTDGFCPMRCHCMLEAGVLEMLQRLFGEMDVMYGDELDAKQQQP
eukprot:s253_g10.t1